MSFNDFIEYIRYRKFQEKPSRYFKIGVSDEIKERAESNEFVQDIVDFAFSNDMETGDFQRLSSFGKVIRGGKESIVLIDFGLSNSVYSDYYDVS